MGWGGAVARRWGLGRFAVADPNPCEPARGPLGTNHCPAPTRAHTGPCSRAFADSSRPACFSGHPGTCRPTGSRPSPSVRGPSRRGSARGLRAIPPDRTTPRGPPQRRAHGRGQGPSDLGRRGNLASALNWERPGAAQSVGHLPQQPTAPLSAHEQAFGRARSGGGAGFH